jgi:class 3 adenylate cyclase
VVGDIVNLSARLMKAAGDNGVLCCKNTFDLVGDTLIFQELPAIMVKGKSQPVSIYRPHPHLKKRIGNAVCARHLSLSLCLSFWLPMSLSCAHYH